MLLTALAIAIVSAGHLPGEALAGVGDYGSTLYLSATSSTVATSGKTLLTSAGPGQPAAAPTAVATTTAGNLLGSFTYVYTVVDPVGGETTASPASSTVTIVGTGKGITVGGLPTGVTVNVYRKGTSGIYRQVASLPANSSSTYADNTADSSPDMRAILPQTQNKPATFGTGYYKFVPGVPLTTTSATSASVASPAYTGEGWAVDASGSVSMPSGTWTFTTTVKGSASNGVAHLVIGMWKVDGTGAVVGSPIIDPTTTGENTTANIATVAGTGSAIVTTINGVPAVSLGAGEHLFVQFWRRQTTGSTGSATTTLFAYDGVTKIAHPTANGFPNTVALGSVAPRVNATPTLSGTFSDPDSGDTGTLAFQLCSDSACASVLQTGTASGVANGASATWAPTTLADGTYFFRAQAQDSAGNQSDWSAASTFTIDRVAPSVPGLVSPAPAARVGTSQLTGTFSDVDPADTDTGTLTFELCTDSACLHLATPSMTTSSLANGASASWTPSAPDATYFWRVRAQDAAGNQSAWSSLRSLTLDTTAPSLPVLDAPADGAVLTARPSLAATFSTADASDTGSISFQICSDAACTGVVASSSSATLSSGGRATWTPSSLADGTYFARVRAQDIAGNATAWSDVRSFSLDMTAPSVPTGSGIADGTRTSAAPTLSATFDDAGGGSGTVTFQLCSDSSCSRIVASTTSQTLASGTAASWAPPLRDAAYYWRTRADDAAGNQSAWSAASSFTFDTTPPPAPTVPSVRARVRSAPLLSVTASSDTARVEFELCSDPACAVVQTAVYGDRAWQAPALADGVYYWRALAQDGVGNESGWSSIASFVVDTVAPDVPSVTGATSDARVSLLELSGAFASSDADDSGNVGFQICADAACTSVVTTAWTANAGVGALQHWTALGLADGTYFWRAAARDAAGNTSAWTDTHELTLDTTPPAKPTALQSTRSKHTLTVQWKLPTAAGGISRYALFVDGKRTRTIDAAKGGLHIVLHANDKRTFAIAAIDAAGNVGVARTIVGARPLVHVALKQAKAKKAHPGKR